MDQDLLMHGLFEAIAAVYATEADPCGPVAARRIITTPAPERFAAIPIQLQDAEMLRTLAGSAHPVARAARVAIIWCPGDRIR